MNYWDVHGVLFLVFVAIFPRITMLVACAGPFGILTWLGWAFMPHLTVAILATTNYWDTNPILCIVSWFVALGGTGGEAKVARHGRQWQRHRRPMIDVN